MKILALDISSTRIGICYDGREFETIVLRGDDIAAKCRDAARLVHGYIVAWHEDVDLVIIESPFANPRRPNGVIPQARVSGAVLALISKLGIAWIEIAPQKAKQALCGKGNASKDDMVTMAYANTGIHMDDHQADAYGLWVAAGQIKVERVAA